MEAKERCEATYNDTLGHTLVEIIEAYRDDAGIYFHCRCEKVNQNCRTKVIIVPYISFLRWDGQ